MKHICNVNCFGHKFGITIDESIDNPGMYRLIREDNGDEIEDMIETEEKAIRTICNKYPDTVFVCSRRKILVGVHVRIVCR